TMHAPIAAGGGQAVLNLAGHPPHLAASLLGGGGQRLGGAPHPQTRGPHDMGAAPPHFDGGERLLEPGQGQVIYGPGPITNRQVLPYANRTGVFEVMPISPAIRRLIASSKPSHEIRQRAIEEGMIGVRQAALLAVARGITSVEEVF